MPVPARHFVNGAPLEGPFPGLSMALFAIRFARRPVRVWIRLVDGCAGGVGHLESVRLGMRRLPKIIFRRKA